MASAATPENRLADLTARLRADNARLAERAQKLETQRAGAAAPVAAARSAARAASNVPRWPPSPPRSLRKLAAAPAPLQPASYGDVTVRPIAQKPSLFPDRDVARAEPQEPATPETFIPQAAERPPVRAPRMPKFEDLPMPAQNEIRQARGEAEEEHPQKTRMSLLQRLANVGLGRRDEETEPPIAARASGPAMAPMPPLPERKPQRIGRAADRGK